MLLCTHKLVLKKNKAHSKSKLTIIPYPKNNNTFGQLVNLGSQIRQLLLLESPKFEQHTNQFFTGGNNIIKNFYFVSSPPLEGCPKDGVVGRVYINKNQYFDSVPKTAWEFNVGGNQPAQKWLKDHKGRKLKFDDILYYQKIIFALCETDRLMKEIDKIEIE